MIRTGAKLRLLLFWTFSCAVGAFAQQPDDPLFAARSLLRQQRNAEALAQLRALQAKNPGIQGLDRELGIAYYREGEYLEAAQYLANAWKENPDDPDAAQLLGLSYYSSGRPEEAIPALERFRSWHPTANIDAIYVLGLCYIMAKHYPQALETFSHLYAVRADSAAAHLLLARMLLRQGFDPVAESEIREALKLSPQLPLAHLTLGEFHVYQGDYLAAIQEFHTELAVNPTCTEAMTHLGEMFWRLNRNDDSQMSLQRSISLDPSAPEPNVIMGKVLVREGELALAEKTLRHALSLDPNSYTAHYFLGQLYRVQGKEAAARHEMNAATRIQQQNPSLRRY